MAVCFLSCTILDQVPQLFEVCEHAKTSHWYQLGIQLELVEVDLEEIRTK